MGENLRAKSKQDLDQRLSGKAIEKAGRRAKFLILELSNGDKLVIHLKLTGQFLLRDKSAGADGFTRLVLDLEDGDQVRFCDRNGAAEAFILDDAKLEGLVGPEPFEISVEDLEKNIKTSTKKTVKEAIVDHRVITGEISVPMKHFFWLRSVSFVTLFL